MKGDDIAERLERYAVGVLRLVAQISARPEGKHIATQLTRSGTAPGAHYEEARRAESRADFVHKLKLAAKEAGESLYWIRLSRAAGLARCDVTELLREGAELTAILMASVRTAGREPSPRSDARTLGAGNQT